MNVIYPETPMAATVDRLREEIVSNLELCDLPLIHRFTPGLYIREIFMPKGTIAITKIHKTEHPYVILKGAANVWIEGKGVEKLKAPHVGITHAGTRRVIYVPEDCIWITFHPSTETDLEKIEEQVILKRTPTLKEQNAADLLPEIINELRAT